MAFHKSKYTGAEIDQRLAQATYDDAVLAGFEGSKEEFDAILGKLKEIADKADGSIQMESENLETFNKNVIDAINELHRELQAKPDERDVIDQGELEVFKDEIAAKYATREEVEGNIQDTNSKISTLNQAIQQNAETLVAEIDQRKEADKEIKSKLDTKVDWVDYNNTKNIVLPSNGQVFGDFGGSESNSSLLGARIYNAGLENEEKQVEVGTSKVHLNLNSKDNVTIETPDGKENLVVESDIELIPKEIRIPIRTLQDKVYTQEEILDWFGVEDIVSLKKIIAYEGIQYVKYGLSLSTNPHYYKMPVEYVAFESANQIKLVFIGLNTRDDIASKYEIIINLDGTVIEGNSNVKMTITNIETEDIDLSEYATKEELNDYALKSEIPDISNLATVATSGNYNDLTNTPNLTVYQTISDDSLVTSAKTIPAAINEVKNSVDQIQAPYEINLTNLLAAEDSESISTAIGSIDNLNATVQDNRIIVGTISNGNVSVSIRILGKVTTLYYLLDSVVGLTLNEVAITNTSGTLSKSITTHSVLTENMVINSLKSDEATLPLSAAQGKVLATDKQNKTDNNLSTTDKTVVGAINEVNSKSGYYIDISTLNNNSTSEEISEAIGGYDNLLNAINNKTPIYVYTTNGDEQFAIIIITNIVASQNSIGLIYDAGTAISSYIINNNLGVLSCIVEHFPLQKTEDDSLNTSSKTVVGAINELLTKVQEFETKNTELESRLAALEGTN